MVYEFLGRCTSQYPTRSLAPSGALYTAPTLLRVAEQAVSGWSRTSRATCRVSFPADAADARRAILDTAATGGSVSLRGAGRSYGDTTLNHGGVVLDLNRLDRVLAFDTASGRITVAAGVTVERLLAEGMREHWLLPTLPGTRYVTLGGALSSNVHGKNCYQRGNLGEWVREVSVLLASGDVVTCSRASSPDLFHAVIGGLGLIGVVLSATIQLVRVPSQYLDVREVAASSIGDVVAIMEAARSSSAYMIARLDTFAERPHRGRGIVSLAVHAEGPHDDRPGFELADHELPKYVFNVVPVEWLPPLLRVALRPSVARLAISAEYIAWALRGSLSSRRESISNYTFPMDRRVRRYNEYFRDGHYQYHPLLPRDRAAELADEILRITHAHRMPSMMSGLKAHRKSVDDFLLSFDLDGYSITLDFPRDPSRVEQTRALFDDLNALVARAGGRIYLAKNAPVDRDQLAMMYPELDRFEKVKAHYDPRAVFQSDFYRRVFRREARNGENHELPI